MWIIDQTPNIFQIKIQSSFLAPNIPNPVEPKVPVSSCFLLFLILNLLRQELPRNHCLYISFFSPYSLHWWGWAGVIGVKVPTSATSELKLPCWPHPGGKWAAVSSFFHFCAQWVCSLWKVSLPVCAAEPLEQLLGLTATLLCMWEVCPCKTCKYCTVPLLVSVLLRTQLKIYLRATSFLLSKYKSQKQNSFLYDIIMGLLS